MVRLQRSTQPALVGFCVCNTPRLTSGVFLSVRVGKRVVALVIRLKCLATFFHWCERANGSAVFASDVGDISVAVMRCWSHATKRAIFKF